MTKPHHHVFDQAASFWNGTKKCSCGVLSLSWRPEVNHHRHTVLTSPWNETIPIDALLVPVVQELWGLGLKTFASCQGGCFTPYGDTDLNPGYLTWYGDGSLGTVLDILARHGALDAFERDGTHDGSLYVQFTGMEQCPDFESEKLKFEAIAPHEVAIEWLGDCEEIPRLQE